MVLISEYAGPIETEIRRNIVLTKLKTIEEANEMWDWADNHCMGMTFMGNNLYHIEGDQDMILFKLRWGI